MKFKWPPLPVMVGIPLVEMNLMVRDLEDIHRHFDSWSVTGIDKKSYPEIHGILLNIIDRLELELNQKDPPAEPWVSPSLLHRVGRTRRESTTERDDGKGKRLEAITEERPFTKPAVPDRLESKTRTEADKKRQLEELLKLEKEQTEAKAKPKMKMRVEQLKADLEPGRRLSSPYFQPLHSRKEKVQPESPLLIVAERTETPSPPKPLAVKSADEAKKFSASSGIPPRMKPTEDRGSPSKLCGYMSAPSRVKSVTSPDDKKKQRGGPAKIPPRMRLTDDPAFLATLQKSTNVASTDLAVEGTAEKSLTVHNVAVVVPKKLSASGIPPRMRPTEDRGSPLKLRGYSSAPSRVKSVTSPDDKKQCGGPTKILPKMRLTDDPAFLATLQKSTNVASTDFDVEGTAEKSSSVHNVVVPKKLSDRGIPLVLRRKHAPFVSKGALLRKIWEIGVFPKDVSCVNEIVIIFRVPYLRARELLAANTAIQIEGTSSILELAYEVTDHYLLVTTKLSRSEMLEMIPADRGLVGIGRHQHPSGLRLFFVDHVYAKRFVKNLPPSLKASNPHMRLRVEIALLKCPKRRLTIFPVTYCLEGGASRKSYPDASELEETFLRVGLDVFLVSPDEARNSGTAFFNDFASAEKFIKTPVTLLNGCIVIEANRSLYNEYYSWLHVKQMHTR